MNRSFIIISIIFILVSCRKEIDIKVPDSERKIVLNALVHPDSVFSANVFRSNHVQDNLMQLLYLNTATVKVFEKGALLEVLALDTSGYYVGSQARSAVGHEYEYVVEVPNLRTVRATTETLDKTPIISVDSVGKTNFDYNDGGMYSRWYNLYRVNFQDNPDTDDYYRIRVEATEQEPYDTVYWDSYAKDSIRYTMYPGKPYMESNDPAIDVWSYYDSYYYFSDKLFNGKVYGFEFGMQIPDGYKDQIVFVYLEHVSSDFYRYIQSVDFQSETDGLEMFFQTVQVFDNIENGFGILGSTSVSKDSLQF